MPACIAGFRTSTDFPSRPPLSAVSLRPPPQDTRLLRPARAVAAAVLCGCALLPTMLAGCGSVGMRTNVSVGPRLSSARLGSIRSAMTYDGDWLGGLPPIEELASDLELAARRGVDFVVDLRSSHARSVLPIQNAVALAGLEFIAVPGTDPIPESEWRTPADSCGVSSEAVDAVREILMAPGRRRSLLLDENGTRSSMIYAIHLTVDEGVAEHEALRAARATGLSQAGVDFVRSEVQRIRGRH